MRYMLRQELFSIGGDSMIQDDQGRDIYFVDGAAISIGRNLTIKDMNGQKLATIHQQVLNLAPKFEIETTSGVNAHVAKKLLSLTDRMKIDVDGGEQMEAHGNLLQHEYNIFRNGQNIAHISKAWVTLKDTYGIEIADNENQILLLSCAVVIEAIQGLGKNRR